MTQHERCIPERFLSRSAANLSSSLGPILLVGLAACGGGGGNGTTDATRDGAVTLAYVVARCREDAAGFVFGPETLQIRRGDLDPVTVMEVPASTPLSVFSGSCRNSALGRAGPGNYGAPLSALVRLAVSPDGSAVVFEVNDSFSLSRNLSSEQKQIFFVRTDGSGLRALGPASRAPGITNQGFRFDPDGRRVVFDDLGPDHAGHEAEQVVLLDIETGERTQVTHLSPDPPGGGVAPPRFVDSETIAFRTTLNADGLHPQGGAFTVRTDGSDLKALPVPVAVPGGTVDSAFFITGDRPVAVSLLFPDIPAVNPHDHLQITREVFVVDGAHLLQLTDFKRVDTTHALLGVDGQRVFFVASTDRLGTNPTGNCQLFSIDVNGADLRQLTNFSEGPDAPGCGGAPTRFWKPLGCGITRLFQDPATQTLGFLSGCDPLGLNPNGVQIFSVRPDGTNLHQLTSLRGVITDTDGLFSAEVISLFAFPGQGSAGSE